MRTSRVLILALACSISPAAATARTVQDLESVTALASRYVADYEQQLGALIAEENYVQDAEWVRPSVGSRGGSSFYVEKKERLLRSDFLILRAGGLWVGFRNVLEVDGVEVEARGEDFERFFRSSVELTLLDVTELIEASAEYNIGDIERNINLPTFALMVLRPDNLERFRFNKVGEETLAVHTEGVLPATPDVQAWVLRFEEEPGPRFLSGTPGNETSLSGRFWIDTITGRVLRSELVIATEQQTLDAAITVRYDLDERLGMWVPVEMEERYVGADEHRVGGRATYSNFRRFEVEVRIVPG